MCVAQNQHNDSEMRVDVIPGRDLSPEHVELWSAIQQSNSDLGSPFFCPEFTLALAAMRKNFRVGILQDKSGVMGFFPFEADDSSIGKPLGICDYQGVIAPQDAEWNAKELVRKCGLKAWDFDHLIVTQEPFQAFHRAITESPLMDLSQGYEAYIARRRVEGTEQIKKCGNLMRKLEREVGPLRYIPHLQETSMLNQLLLWADARWGRTASTESSWVGGVLERILSTQSPRFCGMLSVLYAGDEAVAAHFGMRSQKVWHYWWPAYNPDFARYSPGIILLLRMAQTAGSLGVATIDLGKGGQPYKQRLKSASAPLAEGTVELLSLSTLPRKISRNSRNFIRKKPMLLNCARAVARLWRKRL